MYTVPVRIHIIIFHSSRLQKHCIAKIDWKFNYFPFILWFHDCGCCRFCMLKHWLNFINPRWEEAFATYVVFTCDIIFIRSCFILTLHVCQKWSLKHDFCWLMVDSQGRLFSHKRQPLNYLQTKLWRRRLLCFHGVVLCIATDCNEKFMTNQ